MLRLNPQEHAALIDLIQQGYTYSDNQSTNQANDGPALIQRFIEESQRVLKTEWRRVKKGEFSFRAIKWTSLVVFIISLPVALGYAFHHFDAIYTP